jgi:hypothetical protein
MHILRPAIIVSAIILAIAAVLNTIYGSSSFFLWPFLPVILGGIAATFGSVAVSNRLMCPACGTPQPKWRKPTSVRQMFFGGYTCPNCGTEMDRNGKAIKSPR